MLEVGGYDLLLGAIFLLLFGTIASAYLLAVPVALALGVGSVPAGGLVGYALFVDPPTR